MIGVTIVSENIHNPVRNVWNKMEKYSEIGQYRKSLISTFAYFLTAMANINLWRGDSPLGYVSTLI